LKKDIEEDVESLAKEIAELERKIEILRYRQI